MALLPWPIVEDLFACFFIVLIILLTVGGNLVVLFAFYSDPHLLTPSNNFLLSMAIADLLVGLIGMPFYSFAQIKGFWPFGELFCKIWLTIDDVATMASVLSIVAITIERYWSINHSVHYRRHTTKTRIRVFSVLIWLIPLLNFAPGIWLLDAAIPMSTNNGTEKGPSECIGAYHSYTVYLIIAQINFFAWPLVVILILNVLIIASLYRRSHRFPTFQSINEQRRTSGVGPVKGEKASERRPQRRQAIEHDEATASNSNENNYQQLDQTELQVRTEDHCDATPPVVDEAEEIFCELELVDCQGAETIVLSASADDSCIQASARLYTRIKKALLPSSASIPLSLDELRSPKSTQMFRDQAKQNKSEARSIFTWQRTSLRLSTRKSKTSSGEQRTVRRLRRDKRAATSLLTLVLVFMIFLLPYVVVVVAGNIFSSKVLTDTNGQLYLAVFWLLWLNSTVNPILYPFIQPKFRDAYRRIFQRLTRRRRRLASLIADMQRN